MGYLDRIYDEPSEHVSFEPHPIRPNERVMRLPGATPTADTRGGSGTVLDLVYQAAAVIKGIENQAIEAEKTLDQSHQQLQLARKRIEELEAEKRTAELWISEARTKLKESDEAARVERARLEAAERKMCELEMRARKAEAHAKENANAVARIEEAIRTQLLEKRLPINKLTLSA
jgi:chromosome segregation ATPase